MKSIFITGASSGIGKATALLLDGKGFRVFAGYLPIPPELANVQKLQAQASANLVVVPIDVTESDSISAAKSQIEEAVGDAGLFGLVNCAGIPAMGPIEHIPMTLVKKVFAVNYFGTYEVTQSFIPLIRQATGRIVVISSDGGFISPPMGSAYAGSKYAVEAFADALRIELKQWGISVSCIEPGNVATDIWDKLSVDVKAQRLQPEAEEHYGTMLEMWSGLSQVGMPAKKIAEGIDHALTAKRPKSRYLIGSDAKVSKFLSMLPDRIRDWAIEKHIASYSKD